MSKPLYLERKILVDRIGRVNMNVYNQAVSKIKEELPKWEAEETISKLDEKIEQYSEKFKTAPKDMYEHGFKLQHALSEMSTNKTKKMLINAGVSEEELAEKAGVTEEDIMNEENWKSEAGISTFRKGDVAFQLLFNYRKKSNWIDISKKKKPEEK